MHTEDVLLHDIQKNLKKGNFPCDLIGKFPMDIILRFVLLRF